MKNMKKLLCVALGAALSLSLLAACSGGSATTPAPETTTPAEETTPVESAGTETAAFTTVEEGKLHMSTNAAFPPYEMTTDDGGFEGIDVEVAQAIA